MKKIWILGVLLHFSACAITGNDGKIVNSQKLPKEIVYEKNGSEEDTGFRTVISASALEAKEQSHKEGDYFRGGGQN